MNRLAKIGRRKEFEREAEAFEGSPDAKPCECGHGLMKHEFVDFGDHRKCSDCPCLIYREARAAA